MKQPVLNLITSPDKLYNNNLSFTLVYPSTTTKEQFNEMAKKLGKNLNVYLFEESNDLGWLLDVCNTSDYIILDIDNVAASHKWIIGKILSYDKTFYLTSAESMHYNMLCNRRIFDVGQLAEGEDFAEVQNKKA